MRSLLILNINQKQCSSDGKLNKFHAHQCQAQNTFKIWHSSEFSPDPLTIIYSSPDPFITFNKPLLGDFKLHLVFTWLSPDFHLTTLLLSDLRISPWIHWSESKTLGGHLRLLGSWKSRTWTRLTLRWKKNHMISCYFVVCWPITNLTFFPLWDN